MTSTQPAENSAMFGRIARHYDLANDVLSGGVHRLWRQKLLRAVAPAQGLSALDCATGTGEVALALHKRGCSVVGMDLCAPMLDEARKKTSAIRFDEGDVTALTYPDNSFDIVTIAWGIRNVVDTARGLQEMVRVLKPGGRLGILEFGQPTGAFGAVYRVYSDEVLPRLGGLVGGDKDAYAYLNRSAARFPAGPAFVALMPPNVTTTDTPLLAGVAHLYVATKAAAAAAA